MELSDSPFFTVWVFVVVVVVLLLAVLSLLLEEVFVEADPPER